MVSSYAVVDGGMHHQLAASGNFGQVIRRNYPWCWVTDARWEIRRGGNRRGLSLHSAGPVGDRVALPARREGDLVVLFQAGAYGLTASPTAFLGHPDPVEVLV